MGAARRVGTGRRALRGGGLGEVALGFAVDGGAAIHWKSGLNRGETGRGRMEDIIGIVVILRPR